MKKFKNTLDDNLDEDFKKDLEMMGLNKAQIAHIGGRFEAIARYMFSMGKLHAYKYGKEHDEAFENEFKKMISIK